MFNIRNVFFYIYIMLYICIWNYIIGIDFKWKNVKILYTVFRAWKCHYLLSLYKNYPQLCLFVCLWHDEISLNFVKEKDVSSKKKKKGSPPKKKVKVKLQQLYTVRISAHTKSLLKQYFKTIVSTINSSGLFTIVYYQLVKLKYVAFKPKKIWIQVIEYLKQNFIHFDPALYNYGYYFCKLGGNWKK